MRDRFVAGLMAIASLVAWLYLTTPRATAPVAPIPSSSVAAVATPSATPSPMPLPDATFDATTAFQFKLLGCWPGGTQTIFVSGQVVLLAQLNGVGCLNTRPISWER